MRLQMVLSKSMLHGPGGPKTWTLLISEEELVVMPT